MTLKSTFRSLEAVHLPWAGRQDYMHSFDISNPVMKAGFEDYGRIVNRLLKIADVVEGIAHMTVDEKIIPAGRSQRRPGPHVDGCFMPEEMKWGGGGGWLHHCNELPFKRMPIIIAASVDGACVWDGEFDGQPEEDGDCSHLDLSNAEIYELDADMAYLLSPDCIHDSPIYREPTRRSFLRIALPTDSWRN